MNRPPFTITGATSATTPVVISVPHAGRDYPDLAGQLQAAVAKLTALEDRDVDVLARDAIANGCAAIIAHTPRLIIDLNRAESELDPGLLGWLQSGPPLSARARGGLGLIPRRLGGVGEIWRGPLTESDVTERLSGHYRPYHAALAALLDTVCQRFGSVLLVDLHSMPTIAGHDAPNIVIGDRFGRSAHATLTACAESTFAGLGYRVAINSPYAGGHILDRHARPARGVHAIQIEVDRALYLDRSGDASGPGTHRVAKAIALACSRLADAVAPRLPIAAE